MKEAELRDLLIGQLGVFDGNLKYLAKEKHIPSHLGTRGFIDILAQDDSDRYVLLELKRSNSSSREAIHEILKYVEGVKHHLGVKDDEIRVIIASTEWKELFIPFSRFVDESAIDVDGYKLTIEDKKIASSPITPKPYKDGRSIAPWHDVNY